jgi:hypothetical protein
MGENSTNLVTLLLHQSFSPLFSKLFLFILTSFSIEALGDYVGS